MHVLEDAALYGRDVYGVYIDYSSAFNTIDQDRLLQIMFDLGLPNDLIRAVRNLYAHATTRIRTEHGCTSPIAIKRGTMQGDTLSPVLFIIYSDGYTLGAGGIGTDASALKTTCATTAAPPHTPTILRL